MSGNPLNVPSQWDLQVFLNSYQATLTPPAGFQPQLVIGVWLDTGGQQTGLTAGQNQLLNELAKTMELQKFLGEDGLSAHKGGAGRAISKGFGGATGAANYAKKMKAQQYEIFYDEDTNLWYVDACYSC